MTADQSGSDEIGVDKSRTCCFPREKFFSEGRFSRTIWSGDNDDFFSELSLTPQSPSRLHQWIASMTAMLSFMRDV